MANIDHGRGDDAAMALTVAVPIAVGVTVGVPVTVPPAVETAGAGIPVAAIEGVAARVPVLMGGGAPAVMPLHRRCQVGMKLPGGRAVDDVLRLLYCLS